MVTTFTPEKKHEVPGISSAREPELPKPTQVSGESMTSGGGCSSPVKEGQTPIGTIALLIGVVSLSGRKLFSR